MKIFFIGFMGAGKSTVGRKLAKKMKFRFLDMDTFIERKERRSINTIFKEKGEDHFRILEREALQSLVNYDENLVISTGGGAPCYSDNMELMNSSGITVYLKLLPSDLFQRLINYEGRVRPLIHNKSPNELMDYIINKLEEREMFYNRSKIIYPGDKVNILELYNQINSIIERSEKFN